MDKERLQQHVDNFNQMSFELEDRDVLRLTIKKHSGVSYTVDLEKGDSILKAALTKSTIIKIENA